MALVNTKGVKDDKQEVQGEYTTAQQAEGFGVPAEQLHPGVPVYMGGTVPKMVTEADLPQEDAEGRELFK